MTEATHSKKLSGLPSWPVHTHQLGKDEPCRINRRNVLTATAALPALAVPAAAIAAMPDPAIAACRAVEQAWKNVQIVGSLDDYEDRPEWGEAMEGLTDLEDNLANTRATTLEGIYHKARVSMLVLEHEHSDRVIAQSIVDDLLALSA
jgi:hypothetical protein